MFLLSNPSQIVKIDATAIILQLIEHVYFFDSPSIMV